MQDTLSRRQFLSFMGRTALSAEAALLLANTATAGTRQANPFSPLSPTNKDALILTEGFEYHSILKWGDALNERGDRFGANNDYLAFFPLQATNPNEGLLWVNHESPAPLLLISGFHKGVARTESQVKLEQEAVGGTIARLRRGKNGKWALVQNDPMNRRITALTEIPFAWNEPIAGSRVSVGTLGNCAGGVTSWGNVLTCEENYQDYYGEVERNGKPLKESSAYGWEQFQKRDARHYGWVVEVNPRTGSAKKLVALGRFCHEGATVVTTRSGRLAVYMGDDAEDRCLYKFLSDKPGSLETGTLYVADTKNGRWLALDRLKDPRLKKEFTSQTDLLIHARLAAEIVGGTQLHRPEDIAVDPLTGAVFVALTNSAKRNDPFGSIVRLAEKKGDSLALEFEYATFAAGGRQTGFASPDNLEFDQKGNLWMTSDISGKIMNQGEYSTFANNGLFYIPTQGPVAGKCFQVASAPRDAEMTGPCFAPDRETLFLSIQHPGETSESKTKLTSHWPDGAEAIPRSAVVGITGSVFQRLV